MEERLQKILAASGVASRRKAEELIKAGRVTVDGKTVTELGTKADPEKQVITVNGQPVQQYGKKFYILLHKPKGYTSTRSDPHAEHTVMELVEDIKAPLYPVGRLDVDTEGMLILTNDGEFTQLLTHPKHEIPKTYIATVRGTVTPADMRKLEMGIELEDGMTSPAKASLHKIEQGGRVSVVELTIAEGKKRQVRRMFRAIGHHVDRLVRISVDGVKLGLLKPGTWRNLTAREVDMLRKAAKKSGET